MTTSTPPALSAALLALLLTVGVTGCSDSDTPSSSGDTDQSDLETDTGSDEPAGDVDPATDPTADGESSDS